MNQRFRKYIVYALICLAAAEVSAKKLSPAAERRIDSVINAGIRRSYFPGAQIAVGDRSGVFYLRDYGYTDYEKREKVTGETVYDIASCTKIVATTLAVMRLYDRGEIDLKKSVEAYLPEYKETGIGKVTVSELLTHTSGMPNILVRPLIDSAHISVAPADESRRLGEYLYITPAIDTAIRAEIARKYNPARRGRYLYCDVNFLLLKLIVEKITDTPLNIYTKELFDEMEMTHTGYLPLEWTVLHCIAPTEYDAEFRGGLICGYTHDELAAVCGNTGGNAGLFSNAADLARYCEMMLGKGVFRGRRIVSEETVRLFTASPLAAKGIYRGLGFDKRGRGTSLSGGYGHTGFTGTMIWIDPARDVYMVFLSNRVNPTRTNQGINSSGLRTRLWEIITGQPIKK